MCTHGCHPLKIQWTRLPVPPMNPQERNRVAGRTAGRVLRRYWIVATIVTLGITALAFVRAVNEPNSYVSSASLLFRDPGFDQKLFGTTFFAPADDPEREAATNVQLVSLDAVAERTADALGAGYTSEGVSDAVTIVGKGGSNVISVDVADSDPKVAALIANTFAEQYIEFRREADRSKIREAQALVQRQLEAAPSGSDGRTTESLRGRLGQLDVLASLQTGNAELVQRAEPAQDRSSPRPVSAAVEGFVLGGLAAALLLLLISRLDRRVHDSDEVSDLLGRPVLGVIPHTKSGPTAVGAVSEGAEAYQMLRANLRYLNLDGEIRSLVITSGSPGDGKTTVARNLAVAACAAGAEVVLVEADLRNPVMRARFGVDDTQAVAGLSGLLAGQAEFDQAVTRYTVKHGEDDAGRRLDVLLSGPIPPNPTDLIESRRMDALLEELTSRYDLVIIDTPPVTAVSDAIPLLRKVDGVLAVARMRKSSREQLLALKRQLERVNAPLLGVVVNDTKDNSGAYGYGAYGAYGYTGSAASVLRVVPGEPSVAGRATVPTR